LILELWNTSKKYKLYAIDISQSKHYDKGC
jgi:hypothetical protein